MFIVLALVPALACPLQNPSYIDTTSGTSTNESSTSAGSTNATTEATTGGEAGCPGNLCNYIDLAPIACYEFEEQDTLVDDSGCKRNGTIVSVMSVPGVHGNGAIMGDNSMISVDTTWPELPSLTISAWVAFHKTASNDDWEILRKGGQYGLKLISPKGGETSWKILCDIGGNQVTVPMSELKDDGSWNLVGCGCSEGNVPTRCSEVFVFVKDQRDSFSFDEEKPLTSADELAIAKDYDGCIDSVLIWDRALTAEQTTNLYNAGQPNMDCN